MTTHSAELQWLLIRNSSCFLVRSKKAKATTFTKEPNNLASKNAYKYNSLVNKKCVGVTAGPDNKAVVLVTKNTRRSRKPRDMFVRTQLQKDRRKTYKTIRKSLGSAGYRPDLLEVAVRRASAILASQRPAKRLRVKKRR